MATYKWTGPYAQANRTSATPLGYPWVEIDAAGKSAGEIEIVAPTSDAVLADVGTDKVKAAAAATAEDKTERKGRRPALKKKLKKIAE